MYKALKKLKIKPRPNFKQREDDSNELVYNPQKIEWELLPRDVRKYITINCLDDEALFNTFIRPIYNEGRVIALQELIDRYSPQARVYQEKILSFNLLSKAGSKTNAEFKARLPLHPERVLNSIYKGNVSPDLFVLLLITYQKLADVPDARFDAILSNLSSHDYKIETKFCRKIYLGEKFSPKKEEILITKLIVRYNKKQKLLGTLFGLIYPFLDHKRVFNKRLSDNFEREKKFRYLYDIFLVMLKIGERGSEILENGMTDNFIKLLSCEDITIPETINDMANLLKGTINHCNFDEEKLLNFVKKQCENLTQQIKKKSENEEIIKAIVNRLVLLTPVMSKLSNSYVEDTMMFLINTSSDYKIHKLPNLICNMAGLCIFLPRDRMNRLCDKLLIVLTSSKIVIQIESAIKALECFVSFISGYDQARSADIIIRMALNINDSNSYADEYSRAIFDMFKSVQGLSIKAPPETVKKMLVEVGSLGRDSIRKKVIIRTVLALLSIQSNLSEKEISYLANESLKYLTGTEDDEIRLIINAYNKCSYFKRADQKVLENIIEKNIEYSFKSEDINIVCSSINILIQAFPVMSNEFFSKNLKLLFDIVEIKFTNNLETNISDMLINAAPFLSKYYREKYEEFSDRIVIRASTLTASQIVGRKKNVNKFYDELLLLYLDCEKVHMKSLESCISNIFDYLDNHHYKKATRLCMFLSRVYLKNIEIPDHKILSKILGRLGKNIGEFPIEVHILASQLGKLLNDCPNNTLKGVLKAFENKLDFYVYFSVSAVLVPEMHELHQNHIQSLMKNPPDNFYVNARKEFAKLISKFCIHYGIKGDKKEVITKLAEYYKDEKSSLQHIWLACNKNQDLESIVLEKFGIEVNSCIKKTGSGNGN